MKALVIKKMLAALCALSVIGSSVSVVGAIRENNSNVVNSVNDCDAQIEKLQQERDEVIQERDGNLRELDAAISSDRRKLRAANNLIREGHNEFKNKRNRLERYIKINENEKIKLLKVYAQKISEIDGQIEELKKQKSEFEKKSSNQAVFDNIMKEFENSPKYEPKIEQFPDWEKLRKIDSNNGNIFETVEANIQNNIFSSFGPNASENNNINNHPEGDIFVSFGPANDIDLLGSIVNFPAASQNNNADNDEEDNKAANSIQKSLFGSVVDIKGNDNENNNDNSTNPETTLQQKVEKTHNKGNLQYNMLQNMIYNNKRKIAGIRKSNEGQRREAERAKRMAAMTLDAQNKFRHLSKGIEHKKIDNDLKEVLKKNEQIKKNQNNNNQNDANNKKITLNDFRSLLAGHQNKDNIRTVKGKKVNVWNTCGIFMMTTLKNIYDSIDGKNSKIQGFNNVIDNYERSGADTSLLYSTVTDSTKYSKGENVGRVFSSDDIKSFLEKNNIGMYKLNIDQIVFIDDKVKNPLDVVKPYKDKMIGKVKEFLVSYMKGKNFAPVGVLSGGHWNLLAQYDESSKNVVKLDSLPDEAVMLDIDKAAENCVNVVNNDGNMWTVTCELPIFTRGGGFKTKTFVEIDHFTTDAQKELIKNIENMK